MLLPIGTTYRILSYARTVILAAIVVLLVDACALRRDRALDRQTAAHRSTEKAYQDARAGLLGSDAFLLAERMGSLRMRWRLYDTSLPADSAGRHPLQAEAIIEAGETEKATLSESHLEAGLSLSEGESQSEEHHEEHTAEKSEAIGKSTGLIGGAGFLLLLVVIGAVVIYLRKIRNNI